MKEKCGNCKFWLELKTGFPAFCQNKNNEFVHIDLSTNNPNYLCNFHEYIEELRATMIQYPSRFINKQ